MSILASLLLGSLGSDKIAGGLTQGVKGLFGSGAAENGLMQGAIGVASKALPFAGIAKAGFDIAGDVMAGKNRDRLQTYGDTEGFRTDEFLSRSKSLSEDILGSTGVDDKLVSRAMNGNIIANTKLKRSLEDANKQFAQVTPYLKANESKTIGTNIANSIPSYQSPSYGEQGMKLKPKSKFSMQTKKI